MANGYSRRDFLFGVLVTGTAATAATYFTPNGARSPSTTLQFLIGDDPTGGRDALIGMWQSANPSTRVETPPLSGSTIDQREALKNAITSNRADVIGLDVIDVPYFRQQGLIRSLSRPPGAFLEKALVPCQLGSKDPNPEMWAAPYSSDVGMLFARNRSSLTLVTDPNLTLATVLRQLVKDNTGQFVGQLLPSSEDSSEAFVVNVLEHAVSGNSAVLSEDGTVSGDLEVWQSALEPLHEAVRRGRVTLSTTEAQTTSTYQTGRREFMRNWPAEYRVLQQAQDPDSISSRIQLDELEHGILGGTCLAITSTCRQPAAAQDFINFMTSDSAQKVLASYGVVPAAVAPYNDERLQKAIPFLAKVRGAIRRSRIRPLHPNYYAFSETISDQLSSFPRTGQGLTTRFIDDIQRCLA